MYNARILIVSNQEPHAMIMHWYCCICHMGKAMSSNMFTHECHDHIDSKVCSL